MLPEINYTAWRFWMDFALIAWAAGVAVYVWWVNRTRATQASIDAVGIQVSTLADRVRQLEADVEHLPGKADLERIHARIDDVAGSVREVAGELRPLARQLSMIIEHMVRDK